MLFRIGYNEIVSGDRNQPVIRNYSRNNNDLDRLQDCGSDFSSNSTNSSNSTDNCSDSDRVMAAINSTVARQGSMVSSISLSADCCDGSRTVARQDSDVTVPNRNSLTCPSSSDMFSDARNRQCSVADDIERRKEEAKKKRRKKRQTGSLVSSCFQGQFTTD